MIRLVLLFIFILVCAPRVQAQVKNKGIPFIRNYAPDYYSFGSQSFEGVQDSRGIMYFANQSGVIEFDGTDWRTIETPGDQAATSLALDPKGRIIVGAKGELGFLKVNDLGMMEYFSLKPLVPTEHQNFKEIQKIFITSQGIIFLANEKLLLWQGDQIKVFSSQYHFDNGFLIDGRLYLREWDKGLLKFTDNKFIKVKGSEIFAVDKIASMLPFEENKVLIVSKNKGFTLFSPKASESQKFTPIFDTIANNFIKNNIPTCGLKTSAHQYIIGTSQNGVLVINQQGQVIQHFNKKKGLLNNSVYDIFQDNFKNLWLSLDEGIAHIESNSPFSIYDDLLGIKGRVINATLHKNKLYVGTSQGIFYQNWKPYQNPLKESMKFKPIKDSQGFVGASIIFEDQLIYSHSNGVIIVQDTVVRELIPNEAALSFTSLRKYPNYLLIGKLNGGLTLLEKKEDTWLFRGDIEGIDKYCFSLQEDRIGNIWFSDYKEGIYKLKLNPDLTGVSCLKLYNERHGLPQYSRNSVISLNNQTVFVTREGVYEYNPISDFFEANQNLNNQLFKNTYALPIVQDNQKNLWYIQFGNVGFIAPNANKNKPDSTDFLKLRVNVMSEITPINSNNILFGTQKGLFHYAPQIKKSYNTPFNAHIREVNIRANSGRDSLIFGGAFSNQQKEVISLQAKSQIKVLPYKLNNIKFTFSSAWYEDIDKVLYQCFLDGLDKEWSPWSSSVRKGYTNLPEGRYTFYVRAKNIYCQKSNVAVYHFEILPPWYRTYWAYIIYGVLAILAILFMLRLNTIRLRRKNTYLAREIDKGLLEIRRQNEQLESKNRKIEKAFQDIKLLGEIGKDITTHLSVEKIIDTAYANINMLMDATIFGVGIYNEEKQSIDFMGVKEKGETLAPFSFSLQETHRLAVWCFLKKREVFLNNYQEEYTKYIDIKTQPVTHEDSSSIVYVPLLANEKAIGVITVQSFDTNVYTHYHLDILKNLAIHTSIALENAKSYHKLEALNLEKNHLISIVAHDLRNPLHNIFGLSSVIKLDSQNLTAKQSNYLDKILYTTARINDMIDKILDMNAIESNSLNIHWDTLDVSSIIQEVQESLKDHANRKNITMHLNTSSVLALIRADKNYTLQVFENLISNALKFSPPNQSVVVSIERQNGTVRTKVIDCGPGISLEDQRKLFGKFQKLSAKPTAGEPATGLGLSIVKKYVEAMDGKVWCESEIGNGATFVVDFKAI